MFISENKSILIPNGEKISLEKKEFFNLLKRTPSINGVRTIFHSNFEDNEEYGWSFLCKCKEGVFEVVLFKHKNISNPFSTKDEKRLYLTLDEVVDLEEIDSYFDSSYPLTRDLASGDTIIYENPRRKEF